jgi:hypothetical protein
MLRRMSKVGCNASDRRYQANKEFSVTRQPKVVFARSASSAEGGYWRCIRKSSRQTRCDRFKHVPASVSSGNV